MSLNGRVYLPIRQIPVISGRVDGIVRSRIDTLGTPPVDCTSDPFRNKSTSSYPDDHIYTPKLRFTGRMIRLCHTKKENVKFDGSV